MFLFLGVILVAAGVTMFLALKGQEKETETKPVTLTPFEKGPELGSSELNTPKKRPSIKDLFNFGKKQ